MVAASVPASPPAELPVRPAPRPFIVSPRFDAVFFFASVATVLMAWIASSRFHVDGFYILAAVAVVSNGPHLASTWTRVYMDRHEWRARPVQVFLVPAAIAAVVAGMTLWGPGGNRILNSALLYWATWHFLSQNWGLLRIYQRRSGEPVRSLPLRLERPLLYLSVLWCMLHRLETGPRALFGTEVFYLHMPWAPIDALLALVLVLAVIYLALRLREARAPWATSAWIRASFLGCAFLGFFVPFLLITEDGTTAFAAAACWHGLQYLGIVRFYHRNAWKGGVSPDARIISWLSQPGAGRLFLYAALLLALSGAGFVLIYLGASFTRGTRWDVETWGGVTWLSLTFGHYYLDGVIWKLRKDPRVAAGLLVQPG